MTSVFDFVNHDVVIDTNILYLYKFEHPQVQVYFTQKYHLCFTEGTYQGMKHGNLSKLVCHEIPKLFY